MNLVLVLFGLCCVFAVCQSADVDYYFYQKESTFDPPRYQRGGPTRTHWLCMVLGICVPANVEPVAGDVPNLKLIYQWNVLDFDYATAGERQRDINDGVFNEHAIGPIDMDVFYSRTHNENRVFVTIPRFTQGVPATLGTVIKTSDGKPKIKPFPSWRWHRSSAQCRPDRIVSVFRTQIDECGRLWVLDTGKIGSDIICQPQLLAFDLNTNELAHRYEFPQDVVTLQHLLVTPAVDVRDPKSGCRNTFVYVADVLGFALLVYDVANKRSWRIQDKTFYPYPTYGTYTIAGESFELMDGILGLALSPYVPGQDRTLYYHAMSSPTENYVSTAYLRNRTIFEQDPAAAPYIFTTYPKQRTSQTAAEAINKDGVMLFGLLKDNQIVCWNTRTDYQNKYFDVVASDNVTLQFASGVKIVRNVKGEEELWILTSRFQKLANGSLNPKEPNFRIQAGKLDDLLYGTRCRSKSSHFNQVEGGGYGLIGHSG